MSTNDLLLTPDTEKFPDPVLFETMWELFTAIANFHKINFQAEKMKTGLEIYMATRIQRYPFYLDEYRQAAALLEKKGVEELFDAPVSAGMQELVINEFTYLLQVLTGTGFSKENIKKLRASGKG